jgi:ubiquinone/menaquinone biosynthesis C-methylase UbiE
MAQRKRVGYLHGYSKKEQQRLYKQARFLEPEIYKNIDLKKVKSLIEVGCGVGAQTKILLRRWPHLKITGIDASETQLNTAKKFLASAIKGKKVNLSLQNAMRMNFPSKAFDGAFLCWFLEHVPDPLKVLTETKRVLKKGSVIYISEIQNASLFVEPYSPALLKYWYLFNDQQWLMKGDPFVGAKLGNLLMQAGFRKIEVTIRPAFFDSRDKKGRSKFLSFQTELMLSAAPALLKSRRVTPALIHKMKKEMTLLKKSKESVFFFIWVQARAVK